jgi:hypothetical protein
LGAGGPFGRCCGPVRSVCLSCWVCVLCVCAPVAVPVSPGCCRACALARRSVRALVAPVPPGGRLCWGRPHAANFVFGVGGCQRGLGVVWCGWWCAGLLGACALVSVCSWPGRRRALSCCAGPCACRVSGCWQLRWVLGCVLLFSCSPACLSRVLLCLCPPSGAAVPVVCRAALASGAGPPLFQPPPCSEPGGAIQGEGVLLGGIL